MGLHPSNDPLYHNLDLPFHGQPSSLIFDYPTMRWMQSRQSEVPITPPVTPPSTGGVVQQTATFTVTSWQYNASRSMYYITFAATPADVDVYETKNGISAQVGTELEFNTTTRSLTVLSTTPFSGFISYQS